LVEGDEPPANEMVFSRMSFHLKQNTHDSEPTTRMTTKTPADTEKHRTKWTY
jgi:hypothetical protein